MKIIKNITYMMALLVMICLSCDEMETPKEAPKNIEGSWKIVSASRNEVDITDAVDFSQFRISFNADSTYSLDNYLPFIVKEAGTWSLDDPKYPFRINFRENTSGEPVVTDLTYPIVQGKRQIRLTFSPGCISNKYEYVLEQVTE